jgi:hypothetical protein
MDRLSFDIFEPEKKKFRLTPNWIVYSLWFITIGFFWIFDRTVPPNGTFGEIWIACVFLVNMYYLFASFFTYEVLKGTLKGKIIFEGDSIIISNKVLALKDITSLDFRFIDFYGQRYLAFRGSFNPLLSQGVSNYVTFIDNKNQTQMVYFRMMTKHSALSLYPFINEAVKLKAMTYYREV